MRESEAACGKVAALRFGREAYLAGRKTCVAAGRKRNIFSQAAPRIRALMHSIFPVHNGIATHLAQLLAEDVSRSLGQVNPRSRKLKWKTWKARR
jgi:hypothetical protein